MGTTGNLFSGLITSMSLGGRDVGFTGRVVSLTPTIETVDLIHGQSRTPAATLLRTKKYQLTCSFAEYVMENIATALAQPIVNVGSSGSYLLATGADSDSFILVVAIENENATPDVTDTLTAPAAKIAGSGTVAWDVDNQGFIEVTFNLNADSNGNAFKIVRTAT